MKRTIGVLAILGLCTLALAGCSGRELQAPTDNAQGPATEQLTRNDDVFEANPFYSPDGNWILFESDASGNMDIWRMPAAGGDAEQLTTHDGFDSTPYWAPDGRRFVFESDRSGLKKLWILDVTTTGAVPTALTSGAWGDGSPAWSPDGTLIAFESNRAKNGGSDLWIMPAAGGEAVRLTNTPDGVYHRAPDWSPDGTQLVFESDREAGQSALFTMGVAGGEVRRITKVNGYEGHPSWSPNGREIAFESTASGTMEIYLVAAEGGDALQLTTTGGYWPRWAADGGHIIYAAFGTDMPNLWALKMR